MILFSRDLSPYTSTVSFKLFKFLAQILFKHNFLGFITSRIFCNLDYSWVEANPPHPNANPRHPFIKVEKLAYEAAVNCREPTQPNPGYNESFGVR